jgi:hypothetical protein
MRHTKKYKINEFYKLFYLSLGVSICLDVVSIETRSRRQKSISLDVMDNLDGFQKLVSI